MSGELNYKKLFLHNLDFSMNQDDLHKEFERFGKILKCDVP